MLFATCYALGQMGPKEKWTEVQRHLGHKYRWILAECEQSLACSSNVGLSGIHKVN